MPFVVDASVVGSWMLPDEDHPEAIIALEKLKDDEAFAPSLLWFELRNLLLANERRERITPAQTAAALNLFQELRLRFDSQPDSNTTCNWHGSIGLAFTTQFIWNSQSGGICHC